MTNKSGGAKPIAVADAIAALRAELEQATQEGAGHDLRFEVDSVELELQATVTNTGTGSAGIKWWLFEAGVEGSHEVGTTQTIKLTLKPVGVLPTGEIDPGPHLLTASDD
jgi:hypothetical protein